jgi:hypothetical protein
MAKIASFYSNNGSVALLYEDLLKRAVSCTFVMK